MADTPIEQLVDAVEMAPVPKPDTDDGPPYVTHAGTLTLQMGLKWEGASEQVERLEADLARVTAERDAAQLALDCSPEQLPTARLDALQRYLTEAGIGHTGQLPVDRVRGLVAERDAAIERLDRSTDWYQQRFNRLRRWVNEEVRPLSADVAARYFAICANGSPAPHESADWTGTMHSLTLERDAAIADAQQAYTRANALAYERERLWAVVEAARDVGDIRVWFHVRSVLEEHDCAAMSVEIRDRVGRLADALRALDAEKPQKPDY